LTGGVTSHDLLVTREASALILGRNLKSSGSRLPLTKKRKRSFILWLDCFKNIQKGPFLQFKKKQHGSNKLVE
jgi:hypothetical protein